MKNVTTYTQELLLKMQLVYTAKRRKFYLIYIIITAALGIGLIVMDCLLENYNTMIGGAFFLVCSLAMTIVLMRIRKAKLAESSRKQIQENPNKRMEYQFEEDCIIVNQTSDNVQLNSCVQYSYIRKAVKMDEKSFYFITKNSLVYIVSEENGIEGLFTYMSSKINSQQPPIAP